MVDNTRKKTKKKNKKGTLRTDRIIKICLFVAIIFFIIVLYKIFDKTVLSEESYNLSGENYYQYFFGLKQEYSGNMDLVKENDTYKLILEDKSVVYLDSTPMYYTDVLGKALFTQDMELVTVDNGMYKLKKFTNIIEEDNNIYSKRFNKKQQKALINSFIYDGQDLYFFLEETKVQVGEEEYVLPPLSYAIVSYRDCVELYNYDTDEYTIISDEETLKADVIATNESSSYRINMSVDSFSSST